MPPKSAKVPGKDSKPTRDELRKWIADCRPDESINPNDHRYVPLHRDEDSDAPLIRGDDPILPLFDTITLRGEGSCQLFSGYIGTGKSTELKRLRTLLESNDYTVFYADALQYHDLAHALAIEEFLLILAGAIGEAAGKAIGKDVITNSYWERFLEFLNTEVEITSIDIKPLDVLGLKANVKHGEPLWLAIRRALGASLGRFAQHVHLFIAEVIATVRKARPDSNGVVFLFDSLERLRGPEEEFHKTMESVVRVVTQYPDYLRLPRCHVVYTVPPYALLLNPELQQRYDGTFRVLPSVKVLERGPALIPYEAGVNALIKIVRKRIPADRIFENEDLLKELVLNSGGHVRTLLQYLTELLTPTLRRGLPVTKKDVEKVLALYRDRARTSIRPEGISILDSVRRLGSLDEVPNDKLGLLARYIDTHVVLCYQNGEGWYEVHPLIRKHVADRARAIPPATDTSNPP